MQDFPRHLILLALADGPRHGYEIQQEVMGISGGVVYFPLTSLYRTLKLLDKDGFIERADIRLADGKQIPYSLTRKGASELHRASIVYGDFAYKARQKLR